MNFSILMQCYLPVILMVLFLITFTISMFFAWSMDYLIYRKRRKIEREMKRIAKFEDLS